MSDAPKFVEKFNATFRDRLHAVIDELNLDVDRDPFTKLLANCIASKEYADEVKRELAAERARADRAKAEGIKEGMRRAAEIAGAEEDQFIALAGEAADNTMRKHYSALASGAGTAAAAILKEAGE